MSELPEDEWGRTVDVDDLLIGNVLFEFKEVYVPDWNEFTNISSVLPYTRRKFWREKLKSKNQKSLVEYLVKE